MAFDDLFWPSLAFLAFVALDKFFKEKMAFSDKKLSKIDLFSTIRCQNQFPNEFQQSESLWLLYFVDAHTSGPHLMQTS